MYAYCLYNPMTYKDSFGTDAVVIYDDKSVGHLGFLFQDENDDWFYYYWGPMNSNDKMVRIFVFLNNDYITNEIVSPFYGDPNSLESISANSGYSGTYSDMLYIEGDFSALSKNISDYGNVNYNLYSENCVQHSLKLLASCDTLYKYAFLDTSQHILPSTAMKDLKARVADIVSRRRTYTVRSLTTFRPAGKGTAIYLR